MAETLLPCPFCDSRAELRESEGGQAVNFDAVYQANCPYGCAESPWLSVESDAVAWWNRRATLPGDKTLTDPIAVHVGMLRGDIAMPALTNFLHAIGNGTLEAFRDVVEIAARNEESESVKVARAALSRATKGGDDDQN